MSPHKTKKPAAKRRSSGPGKPPRSTRRIREIPAGVFKARCLSLLDRVHDRGEVYVVTKRGKPVAKLVALDEARPESWGWMRGTVRAYADLISPIDVEWEAGADR